MPEVFSRQFMKRLAATRTLRIEQSLPWKAQILFWMVRINLERTPLPSAPRLQCEKDTECLQFRMVDGVQPVLQRHRPMTSTESRQIVSLMVKVDHGQIKFMLSQVIISIFPNSFIKIDAFCMNTKQISSRAKGD